MALVVAAPPVPSAGAGRWLLPDGQEVQGTPAEAVRQMRLRAFGCPHGTSGPLGPYAAWVAGRVGGQQAETLGDDEAAAALLALLEARGLARRLEAQVLPFRARRAPAGGLFRSRNAPVTERFVRGGLVHLTT